MLDKMIISDFPHIKKERRSTIHSKLKRKMRQEDNLMVLQSTEQIAKVIGGLNG